MNTKLFFILILLSLFSCNDSSYDELENGYSNNAISFSTDTSSLKGSISGIDNISNFGVYAYYTENSNFEPNVSLPNFMYNVNVSKQGSSWTYSPRKYWPSDVNDKISFFAYAPFMPDNNDNGIVLSNQFQGGAPSLTYTLPIDAAQQPDLMIATEKINRNKSNISFAFEHVLSCIKFEASGKGRIKSIVIKGIRTQGEIDLEVPFEWRNLNTPQNFNYYAGLMSNPHNVDSKQPVNILANDGYFMMLPQVLTNSAKIVIEHKNGAGGGGGGSWNTTELSIKNDLNTYEWEKGFTYTYVLNLQ